MKVKRQGTSKFVTELVTNWLKEIRDPATLDDFEKMIKERRAMLMIETEDERKEKIIAHLKDCKQGDTLYLVKPLPRPAAIVTTAAKKYADDANRMQCKFYQWQPRKKILWVYVPWTTKRQHYKKNFVKLEIRDIKRLEPSRTEAEIRLKNRRP
jgi:hypothetical protein